MDNLVVGRDEFLDHRLQLEKRHLRKIADSTDPVDAILTVEINTTELCNKQCVFCPRVDEEIYPNQNINMTPFTATTIAKKLKDVDFIGRVSFSGYGENLLNKDFLRIVGAFRTILGDKNIIECNTNGTTLTSAIISKLFDAGLSYLYVNLYDKDTSPADLQNLFKEAKIESQYWKIRDHTDESTYGLFLNNRSGMLKGADQQIEQFSKNKCNYPFYKMMVDWNANVLFCTNDWGRKRIIGNLLHHTVREIWLSDQMNAIRKSLYEGNRNFEPCSSCSVNGTLFGQESADLIMDYLNE